MLFSAHMAPHDAEPATPRPALNSPEARYAATERLRTLGIDDEVVFSCEPAPCAAGGMPAGVVQAYA